MRAIGIKRQHVLASGSLESRPKRSPVAGHRLRQKHGTVSGHHLGRAVGGAAVNDEELMINAERLQLSLNGWEELLEVCRFVQGRNQNRELAERRPVWRRRRNERGDAFENGVAAMTGRAGEHRLAARPEIPPAGRAGQARNGVHRPSS